MKKGLYALALGTFGFGIAEFSMMSLLPDIAGSFHVTLPEAGHLISAYALGVCVGAPLFVLVARNWKLRTILLALMTSFVTGNLLMCISPNFYLALCARFISGLPHGAYFGTGVIVASRLAANGKSASAVSTMVMGMSIANLLGVPMGSFVGHYLSWRVVFGFATMWGLFTLYGIHRWIPELPALPQTSLKGQFRFLTKPEPWLIAAATMFGNGGIFCWYSYINPLMVDVSGLSVGTIPFLMVLSGCGMCLGNYLGGFFSDRFSPGKVGMYTQMMMTVALLAIFFLASHAWMSILLMFICTTCLFAVSSPQQLLLMRHSPGGELMGGAMVQLAFNFGNAVGAYFGGLPIDAGMGVEYTALIGSAFTVFGTLAFFIFNNR